MGHREPSGGSRNQIAAPWWSPSTRAGAAGIGFTLAEAADAHLGAIGVTTTRAGSIDEPGARALATRLGFTELAASATSAIDPRTVTPEPVPDGVPRRPLRGPRRPARALQARPGGVE